MANKKTFSHVLCGKRYRIKLVPPSVLNKKPDGDQVTVGLCDPPNKKDKLIQIDNTLSGLDKLEIIAHEAWHGLSWSSSEEWVDQSAKDVSSLLWKMGYRQIDELIEEGWTPPNENV